MVAGSSSEQHGGNVAVQAGRGGDSGGAVSIGSGASVSAGSGTVNMSSSDASSGKSGSVTIGTGAGGASSSGSLSLGTGTSSAGSAGGIALGVGSGLWLLLSAASMACFAQNNAASRLQSAAILTGASQRPKQLFFVSTSVLYLTWRVQNGLPEASGVFLAAFWRPS